MSAAVRMHCDEGLNKKGGGYISAQLDAATVSCRGLTHLEKKKKKSGCMGEDVGVFVWERGKK